MKNVTLNQDQIRFRYLTALIGKGAQRHHDLNELSLVELRDLYEVYYPSVAVRTEASGNGVKRSVIILSKAA